MTGGSLSESVCSKEKPDGEALTIALVLAVSSAVFVDLLAVIYTNFGF